MQTEQKHKCIPYWKIDENEVGVCQKCNPKTLICSDNGKPCPYGGVRDFRKLQEKVGLFRAYVTYEIAHPHDREESDEREP
ncbi:hypothetical protein ES703_61865 [subsurface metagenome]